MFLLYLLRIAQFYFTIKLWIFAINFMTWNEIKCAPARRLSIKHHYEMGKNIHNNLLDFNTFGRENKKTEMNRTIYWTVVGKLQHRMKNKKPLNLYLCKLLSMKSTMGRERKRKSRSRSKQKKIRQWANLNTVRQQQANTNKSNQRLTAIKNRLLESF